MESIESEGKTVAEAVDAALKKLGLRRDQVEVQILQEASAGFLGIGARPARVRITEKRWGDTPAPRAAVAPARNSSEGRDRVRNSAVDTAPTAETADDGDRLAEKPALAPDLACEKSLALAREVIALMGFEASATASWDPVQERVRIALAGADAERLASGDGRTLEALQFLITLIVSRRNNASAAVQIDALGYWDRKEKDVLAQAQAGAAEARRTGKPYRLPPMDASMRRLVHRHFAGSPDVETVSEGEGSWRKIVLRPRRR